MKEKGETTPINKAYLKCHLCQQSFLGYVDYKLNTHAYGGTRVPGRLIVKQRRKYNAEHEMDKRLSSIAHGETQVHVCVFCSQFFTFRKHQMNFHNDMIEHYQYHERAKDINAEKMKIADTKNANEYKEALPVSRDHEYFCASKAKQNLAISIDRMIRWKEIDKDPDAYYIKMQEQENENVNDPEEDDFVTDEELLRLQLNYLKFKKKVAQQNNNIMIAKNNLLETKLNQKHNKLKIPHKPFVVTNNDNKNRPMSARSYRRKAPLQKSATITDTLTNPTRKMAPRRPNTARGRIENKTRSNILSTSCLIRRQLVEEAVSTIILKQEQEKYNQSQNSRLSSKQEVCSNTFNCSIPHECRKIYDRKHTVHNKLSKSISRMEKIYSKSPKRKVSSPRLSLATTHALEKVSKSSIVASSLKKKKKAKKIEKSRSTIIERNIQEMHSINRSKSISNLERRQTTRIGIALKKKQYLLEKKRNAEIQRINMKISLEKRKHFISNVSFFLSFLFLSQFLVSTDLVYVQIFSHASTRVFSIYLYAF